MLQTNASFASTPRRDLVSSRALRSVTVSAQHSLIGEAVRAALAGAGLAAGRLAWEDLVEAVESGAVVKPVLLLCELEPASERRAAVAAVRALSHQCVVLTDADPGPSWGAVLEAGAMSVLPSSTDVDQVVAEVDAVLRGERPFSEERRRALEEAWTDYRQDHLARCARVERLSPRERSVLELMHQGQSVSSIAETFGVAESTVRSQVRRLFAKLEVRSQLAAVAVYAGYMVEND